MCPCAELGFGAGAFLLAEPAAFAPISRPSCGALRNCSQIVRAAACAQASTSKSGGQAAAVQGRFAQWLRLASFCQCGLGVWQLCCRLRRRSSASPRGAIWPTTSGSKLPQSENGSDLPHSETGSQIVQRDFDNACARARNALTTPGTARREARLMIHPGNATPMSPAARSQTSVRAASI